MKVVVTNCTRNSGLVALRSLARGGWNVVGADDRLLPLGLRSRHASAPYELLPDEDSPGFATALLELLRRTGPAVLIPTRGCRAASHHREALERRTHLLVPDAEAFDTLYYKTRLMRLCASLGIAIPRVLEPGAAAEWLRAHPAEKVVVKPSCDVGAGEGVHIVDSPERIEPLCGAIGQRWGEPLVTEYVPGPAQNMRAVHLLFDRQTRLIAWFAMRKVRLWPAGVGIAASAVSAHDYELVRALLPLFESLRWRGAADAEFKIDARDGVPRLLEINPRLSGAIHFPMACGVDFPALYCRGALGERLPATHEPRFAAGVRYLDRGPWLASMTAQLQHGVASGVGRRREALAHVWRDFGRPRVSGIGFFEDPAPFVGKWLLPLERAVARRRRGPGLAPDPAGTGRAPAP